MNGRGTRGYRATGDMPRHRNRDGVRRQDSGGDAYAHIGRMIQSWDDPGDAGASYREDDEEPNGSAMVHGSRASRRLHQTLPISVRIGLRIQYAWSFVRSMFAELTRIRIRHYILFELITTSVLLALVRLGGPVAKFALFVFLTRVIYLILGVVFY